METDDTVKLSECEESYVETIYDLIQRYGYARVVDIAEELKVKPPSVTNMLQKLDDQKFVNYKKYRGVVLTSKGKLLAKTLEQHHHALRDFLTIIGVSEEIAEKDACEIEHKIDRETIEKLAKFVEFIQSAPETPHFLTHFRQYNKTGKRPKHCTRRS